MPSNNIEVGLRFTADTSNASKQIARLKDEISQAIQNVNNPKTGALNFEKAINQAAQLRGILDAATNETGRLDLTKFQRGLNAAGLDMRQVYSSLQAIGAENAFGKLTNQIIQADTKSKILSGTLQKFATGLKNTAMWTIQSNAIHAVQGALQGAFSYAQRLNKGLTDIAIVSDLTTDQLAAFAKSANAAAKELSATTNEYVKGALIYYQQGLNDEAVKERTETTIKMANASGESAETISSYMTAIWNNFDHGSESVEHYADVIALLGATTAASNAQIAEGMQAFAATAETVGLSYEYSAAALTTLVDRTQQSASKIGTSLKTIFARLSSVSLGETLEDDVNLTKYTAALEKVGVDVLTATGDLKDMNDILDDLGSKWDSLNQAQKVAVAQTVGGVRQYNNLISLLDNYDYFKDLVSEAEEADGYLQTQQDKYAASWEGANKRVQASWETLYSQILDDKFFIGLTNTLADIIDFITDAIDGMGGLKGLVGTIIGLITSINPERFESSIARLVEQVRTLVDELNGTQLLNNLQTQRDALSLVLGKDIINGKYAGEINGMYENISNWITRINELQSNGDKEHSRALLEITERYSRLADKAVEANNRREKAIQELYNTDLPDKVVDYVAQNGSLSDAQLNGYEQLKQDLQSKQGDLLGQQQILQDLRNSLGANYGLKGYGLLKLDDLIPPNLSQLTEKEVGDVFNRLDTLISQRTSKIKSDVARAFVDMFDKDVVAKNADQIEAMFKGADISTQQIISNQLLEQTKNLQDDIAAQEAVIAATKVEETNQENASNTEAEEKLNTLKEQLKAYEDIIDRLRQIETSDQETAEILKKAGNIAKGLPAQDKPQSKGFDTKQFTSIFRSATQAASSIMALSSSIEGLRQNIKEGDMSIGQLTGSLTGIMSGLSMSMMGVQGLGTALVTAGGAAAKFGAALTGPIGIISVLVLSLLPTAISLIKEAWPPSLEDRIESVNTQIETQKSVIEELNNEYKNVASTIDDLTNSYEELTNVEFELNKNAPDYWLQRMEYIDKVNELIEKYGDGIKGVDKDGLISIDGDKLKAAQLTQLNFAKNEKTLLDTLSKNLELQKLEQEGVKGLVKASDNVVGSRHQVGSERSASHYTRPSQGVDESALAQTIFDNAVEAIKKSEFRNITDFEGWEELSEETKNVVQDKIREYLQLFADTKVPIVDFSGLYDALAGTGLQGGVEQYVGDNGERWLQQSAQHYASDVYHSNEEGYQELAQQNYVTTHEGATYENGVLTDENGNVWDEARVQAEGLALALAEVTAQLQLGDENVVNAILSYNPAISGQSDNIKNYAEDERIEADRVAGANKDIETLGLDAKEVNEVAEAVTNLIDQEDKLEDTQKTIAPATKAVEGSLKKLATAAEQTQEGYDELEEGYTDWYKAIKKGDELAKAKAMGKLKESLSDIIGTTDELSESGMQLGQHFGKYLEENQEVVERALGGDKEAILELQEVAAEDIALQLGIDTTDFDIQLGDTTYNFETFMDHLSDMALNNELKLGRVDDTELLASLTQIINSVEMTSTQAQSLLAGMGFDAEVEEVPVTETSSAAYWIPATYSEDSDKEDGVTRLTLESEGHWETQPVTIETGATSLRIKTADYVGGGNILAAPGGTNAGRDRVNNTKPKGGGGKGKKGGGKTTTHKAKKAERYHEINDQLDQQSKKLEKIQSLEERAYGSAADNYADQHIAALKEQADLYEKLANEAEKYLAKDTKKLTNKYNAEFNADGTIKNYQEWYNYWAKELKEDEEGLAKFEEAIKNYEDSLDKVVEAKQNQIDSINAAYDEALKKINDKLERQNALIEDNLKLLEYEFNRLKDDGTDAAQAISNITSQMMTLRKESKKYTTAIKETLEVAGASSKDITKFLNGDIDINSLAKKLNLTPEAIEDLRKYKDGLLDINEQMYDMRESAIEELNKSLDAFADKTEKSQRRLEYYGNRIQHLKNVVDIIGQDAMGVTDDAMMGIAQGMYQNALQEVKLAKDYRDSLRTQRDELKEKFKKKIISKEEYDAQLAEINERIRTATEDLKEKEEEALEAASQVFQTHLDTVVKGFETAMAGPVYKTLDNLQQAFERQKKLDELYVEDFQKIHDLNKLSRDVQKSMDNTTNVKAMERLKELQDEINDGLREGNQLTEYNIAFLQKKYELRLAEIALEEAQNTKNQVRMTRTSEGDWSYTYYANEDKVADAQQNYEDKLYDLEKLNQDYTKSVQDLIMANMAEYRDQIKDLNLTDKERTELLQQYYEQLQQQYGVFLKDALDDAAWITETFDVTDHKLIDGWDDTTLAAVTNFSTLDELQSTFSASSAEMVAGINEAYQEWETQWHDTLKAAGENAKDYNKTINKVTKNMVEKGEKVVKTYEEKVVPEQEKAWKKALNKLKKFAEDWNKYIQGMIDDNKALATSIIDLETAYEKLSGKKKKKKKTTTAAPEEPDTNQDENKDNGDGKPEIGDVVTFENGKYHNDSYGRGSSGSKYLGQKVKINHLANGNPYPIHISKNGGDLGWVKKSQISGYDTGGYTGAWGNEGKLAMLHEKELVLNKEDTGNILAAVQAIRDISSQLSVNANIYATGFGALTASGVNTNGPLEQVVNINANFPDAVYHDEIRMAFEELANQASQYIGRK